MKHHAPIARLRQLCDESGLLQSEIAERCQMTQGTLSRLLSGKRDPAISTVARVLNAIGCRWADLDEADYSSDTDGP